MQEKSKIQFNLTKSMIDEILKVNELKKKIQDIQRRISLNTDSKEITRYKIELNNLKSEFEKCKKKFIKEFQKNNKQQIAEYKKSDY